MLIQRFKWLDLTLPGISVYFGQTGPAAQFWISFHDIVVYRYKIR